jgi:hypothetical protein
MAGCVPTVQDFARLAAGVKPEGGGGGRLLWGVWESTDIILVIQRVAELEIDIILQHSGTNGSR